MSDLNKLYLDIHNNMKSKHGFTAKALWGSEYSQQKRFDILTKCIIPSREKIKVLDIGSGLGHLYRYLQDKGFDIDYTGLEINESFYTESKKTYANAKFILGDVHELTHSDELYDYSFASGIYNLGEKISTQHRFQNDFSLLWPKIKICAVVNFLSAKSDKKDNQSLYHEPNEIIEIVKSNFTDKYELIENYLPNDFTINFQKRK